MEIRTLPAHDEMRPLARGIEAACLMAVCVMVMLHVFRLLAVPEAFHWWHLPALLAGMLLADLSSGIVHWVADTWGSETMPVLGPRFLRPFRIHHINPDDFLGRDFIDTNGDVAMINIPFFLAAFLIPLEDDFGSLATVFMVAFNTCSVHTNQIHQWAHMSHPPRLVRWLQEKGLILSREQHQRHHTAPFVVNYCITTGWCNQILTDVGFFPAAERTISWLTGLKPRGDGGTFTAQIENHVTRRNVVVESMRRRRCDKVLTEN